MEADMTDLAGPKGRHDEARTAVRHGREPGSVTLGGRRVPVSRPRVRAADGSGELAIASYELFTSTEIIGRMAMEKMLAGLSTRRYRVRLEPVGQKVAETCSATSKSAVSRKFVAMTETALAEEDVPNSVELRCILALGKSAGFSRFGVSDIQSWG
jgi:putative transposase